MQVWIHIPYIPFQQGIEFTTDYQSITLYWIKYQSPCHYWIDFTEFYVIDIQCYICFEWFLNLLDEFKLKTQSVSFPYPLQYAPHYKIQLFQ